MNTMITDASEDGKRCQACGILITHRPRSTPSERASRKFCSMLCSNRSHTTTPIFERMMRRVQMVTETGCWIYEGTHDGRGYAHISTKRAKSPAKGHRVSYEHHYGPIKDGLFVCHKCDTPSCVNPHHLFLGTQADNMQDAKSKGRLPDRTGQSRGEKNPFSKLTWDQAREIRRRISMKENFSEIAKDYPVKVSTISKISQNLQWVEHEQGN